MKVALYARVSTRDKGQNPEMQMEPLRQYCRSMSWEITKEYVDRASSSDLLGRTAWAQLMKDASLRRFETLLIWKLDRAFRSVDHANTSINMFNAYRIGFRSLMDPGIDTTTPNGQLLFNILASVAQFEKDLMIIRINEGMEYAKAHGTRSGLPIGRKSYDISFASVCKALIEGAGGLTVAAKILSKEFGIQVSPGFVLTRIKRAGFTKEDILTGRGLQKVG